MLSALPSCEENDPNPQSGQDLDPDKLVYAMACRGNVTNPTFLRIFFVVFIPESPSFRTDPRASCRVGSSGTSVLTKTSCDYRQCDIFDNMYLLILVLMLLIFKF